MEDIHPKKKISDKIAGDKLSTEEELDQSSTSTNPQPRCPYCGSTNVYGISRVVGYYSVIDNWNKSKQAELKRRQEGNYWHTEE